MKFNRRFKFKLIRALLGIAKWFVKLAHKIEPRIRAYVAGERLHQELKSLETTGLVIHIPFEPIEDIRQSPLFHLLTGVDISGLIESLGGAEIVSEVMPVPYPEILNLGAPDNEREDYYAVE